MHIDVPINLSGFTKGKEVLALTGLGQAEPELAAGTMVQLHGLAIPARYGILRLKTHSLSPAALEFIAEIRAVEAEIVEREEELAAIYG